MVVVLPAPFGPEEAVHLAGAHRQVEAVQRPGRAEVLDQPAGHDGLGVVGARREHLVHVSHAGPAGGGSTGTKGPTLSGRSSRAGQISFLNKGIGACRMTMPRGAQGSAGTQAESFSFSIALTIARTPFSVEASIGLGLGLRSFISEAM